jgi:hypothetical protein
MKDSKALKVILFIAGLMFIIVGFATMVMPVDFAAMNGADILGQLAVLNDYRGSGGLMLGGGIIMMAGVFSSKLRYTSIVVATVMYLGKAIGRVVSFGTDGMPGDSLVKATVVEFVVGLAVLVMLMKFEKKSS